VPYCKSFLVTEAERKHVGGDARDFNDLELLSFFFLQGKALKEIQSTLQQTFGEHAPSYATFKNLLA
jgi:hypothetical protein